MCREEVRKYLKCRMDAGLMAQEELNHLGMGKDKDRLGMKASTDGQEKDRADEEGGFTSGMRLAKRKKERYKSKKDETKPEG